jgi:hypothetical protein
MLDVERESLLDVVLAKARSLGIQEKIQRVLIALTYAKASDSGQEVAAEIAANISQLEVADEQVEVVRMGAVVCKPMRIC